MAKEYIINRYVVSDRNVDREYVVPGFVVSESTLSPIGGYPSLASVGWLGLQGEVTTAVSPIGNLSGPLSGPLDGVL